LRSVHAIRMRGLDFRGVILKMPANSHMTSLSDGWLYRIMKDFSFCFGIPLERRAVTPYQSDRAFSMSRHHATGQVNSIRPSLTLRSLHDGGIFLNMRYMVWLILLPKYSDCECCSEGLFSASTSTSQSGKSRSLPTETEKMAVYVHILEFFKP